MRVLELFLFWSHERIPSVLLEPMSLIGFRMHVVSKKFFNVDIYILWLIHKKNRPSKVISNTRGHICITALASQKEATSNVALALCYVGADLMREKSSVHCVTRP